MEYTIKFDEEKEIAILFDGNNMISHPEAGYLINCVNNFYYTHSEEYVEGYNNKLFEEAYNDTFEEQIDYSNCILVPTGKLDSNGAMIPKIISLKNAASKYNSRAGFVYIMECAGKYKIGFSKNVDRRLKELNDKPFPIKLVHKQYYDDARTKERMLHEQFKDFNINYEWFDLSKEQINNIIIDMMNDRKGE